MKRLAITHPLTLRHWRWGVAMILGGAMVGEPVWGLGIVVNEFLATETKVKNGEPMASDEYIEFLITAPSTADDLALLSFGDTDHTTGKIETAFVFDFRTLSTVLSSAGLTAFLPGTLIVVKGEGLGPQSTTYNPLAAAVEDHDAWSIELAFGQGFRSGLNGPSNKAMDLDVTKGDLVYVAKGVPADRRDTSGFVDALGVDNNPGRIAVDAVSQFGATAVTGETSPTGNVALQRGDAASGTQPSFNVPTMGEPGKTGPGAILVQDFRLSVVPEPGRMVLVLVGLAGVALRRNREGRRGER